MSNVLLNRARMTVGSAPGSGAITLGSAVSGYQSFAAAGLADGKTVSYVAEDGVAWEVGTGTYTASGTVLARTSITETSNGNTTPLTLSGSTIVTSTIQASDVGGSADGWVPITFGTTTTIFGTAGTYVSDQSFTLAAGQMLQIEGFVYKSSSNNGLLGLSADATNGYVMYNGTSGSRSIDAYYSGGYHGFLGSGSLNWSGQHELDMSVSAIGSTDNAVWGFIDGTPIAAGVDTNVNLVGTVVAYLVTNDITKCAFHARVVTQTMFE
jgi:hypothetical protein